MAAFAVTPGATSYVAHANTYRRFAGICAILTGALGFLYAVAVLVLRNDVLSALSLTLVGMLSTVVVVALYERLKDVDASFALWMLVLGAVGALGSAVHGGYDLANALHPPGPVNLDLPSQVDPRGLLTFGVTGLGVYVTAWLILRGAQLPKTLGYLGYLAAALLVVLYVGRLTVLDPTSLLIVIPAVLAGFIVNPIWYVWLGLTLGRGAR